MAVGGAGRADVTRPQDRLQLPHRQRREHHHQARRPQQRRHEILRQRVPSSCSAAGPPVRTALCCTCASSVGGWRSPASSPAWSRPGRMRSTRTQREHEKRQSLRRLRASGHQAQTMNSQTKRSRTTWSAPNAAARRRAAAEAEPHREADRRHDDHTPGDERRVGAHPAGHDRQQSDRQAAQPVEETSLEVLGQPLAAPMPWKSTPVTTNPGTRKSTYEPPGVRDRPAEHVTEDEQEEDPLRRPRHDAGPGCGRTSSASGLPPGPRRRGTTPPVRPLPASRSAPGAVASRV